MTARYQSSQKKGEEIKKNSEILQQHLKSNLDEIVNCIAIIDLKKNQVLERLNKKIEKMKETESEMLKKIKEKYGLEGDENSTTEKAMWRIVSRPTKSDTTETEVKTKDKLFKKLKDLKIIHGQIKGIEKEINMVKEKHKDAMIELYGKERILSELKGSIGDLIENISYLDKDFDAKEKVVDVTISELHVEKREISENQTIDDNIKDKIIKELNKRINLEEEYKKKYQKEYYKRLGALNKSSIQKNNLMQKMLTFEMNELQAKKNQLQLTPSQVNIIDKKIEQLKLDLFLSSLEELQRQEQAATTNFEKDIIITKIKQLKNDVNEDGGLRYKSESFFFTPKGLCFYTTESGTKIYKRHITSNVLYEIDSFFNLIPLRKKTEKSKLKLIEFTSDKQKKGALSDDVTGLMTMKADGKLLIEERDMLRKDFGSALPIAVSHVTLNRPNNPTAYLGHFLAWHHKNSILGMMQPDDKICILQKYNSEIEEEVVPQRREKRVTLDPKTPVISVSCETAFDQLNEREKRYAYYLCKANAVGKLLIFLRTSSDSPLIFILLHKIFVLESVTELHKNLSMNGFKEEEIQDFLLFAASVTTSCGNYKRLSRTKIIPNMPKWRLKELIKHTKAYNEDPQSMTYVMFHACNKMYRVVVREQIVGTYNMFLTRNITYEDIAHIKKYLTKYNQILYHRRVKKHVEGNHIHYEIMIDSILKEFEEGITVNEETFEDGNVKRSFKMSRGFNSSLLVLMKEYLKKALHYADYCSQRYYIKNLLNYIITGNTVFYNRASIKMVKENSPIEIFFGFIQTWEDKNFTVGELGTVVVIENRKKRKTFETLQGHLKEYIAFLPWPSDFDQKIVTRRHVMFRDVACYASSALKPVLTVPYTPEIREQYGVKKLIMTNFLSAVNDIQHLDDLPFLSKADSDIYKRYYTEAFMVKIYLRLLIGDGSGKLLMQTEMGTFNFSNTLKNPITKTLISRFYRYGETFKSKFGPLAYQFKNLRSCGIALYSCLNPNLFKDLNRTQGAGSLTYVMWLNQIYSGIFKSLHNYDTEAKKWIREDNIHDFMLARYLMEIGGKSLFRVTETKSVNIYEEDFIEMSLVRENIYTIGKQILGNLILELTIIKSIGDVEHAEVIIRRWSAVPDKGRYPYKNWYKKYIARTYSDTYKIPVTEQLVFIKTKEHTSEEVDTEDLEAIDNAENMKRKKSMKIARPMFDDRDTKTKLVDTDAALGFKFNDATLFDDTMDDEENDDETPPPKMPTDGYVKLVQYPATPEGAINSFIDTFSDMPGIDFIVEENWAALTPIFSTGINLNTNPIENIKFENYTS